MVSEKLLSVMKEKGITMYRLSKITGMRYELIRRIFCHQRKPTADEFVLILQKTGITYEEVCN